jgi:hypothetical protein
MIRPDFLPVVAAIFHDQLNVGSPLGKIDHPSHVSYVSPAGEEFGLRGVETFAQQLHELLGWYAFSDEPGKGLVNVGSLNPVFRVSGYRFRIACVKGGFRLGFASHSALDVLAVAEVQLAQRITHFPIFPAQADHPFTDFSLGPISLFMRSSSTLLLRGPHVHPEASCARFHENRMGSRGCLRQTFGKP